jgi:hypothetical protein
VLGEMLGEMLGKWLCKPVLNFAFVYDDKRFLFKQTYSEAVLDFVGAIIQLLRHFFVFR